jgi:acyl dehydratase
MTGNTFSTPITDRYFEDYIPGSIYEFGTILVTQEQILAFAKDFDPQDFHADPEAAKQTIFGGLIASGFHTAGLMMRLYADHYLSRVASLSSPGVDELRWKHPVRPGDALSIRVKVVEARRSNSKPDRGIVRSFIEVLNQSHEVVMSMSALNLLLSRNASQ